MAGTARLADAYEATLPAHPGEAAPPRDRDSRVELERSLRERKRRSPDQNTFTKWLLRMSEQIDSADREKRLNLIRSQIKAHQYLDGNFRGYVGSDCQWHPDERREGEVWYQDNQLYPLVRTALMELSRSQTAIVINAAPGTGERMKAAAKFAQGRYDANRERTYTELKQQTRNAYALLNGIVFLYTYADFSGRPERFPRVDDSDDSVVIGYDEVGTMNNQWVVINPVAVVVALNATCVRDTPYLMWKQLMLRSVLEAKYPDIDFSRLTDGSSTVTSHELRYVTDQQGATPGGGVSGSTEDGTGRSFGGGPDAPELEQVEFRQVWLDYPLYCDKTFETEVDLGRGEKLRPGQKLGELRPHGLWYAHVGDLVVDNWDEDKNRKWASSPYGLRPGSMYGSGVSVSLPQQDLINDIKGLEMANMWNNAVPKEFVDPNKISELSVDPAVPTKVDMTDEGSIIGNAYATAPPLPLSAEVYALEDNAKGSMQNQIGALSGGTGGLADAQKWGDTATAISIKRDLSVGRFSPDLALMADQLDREQAHQFLRNEQEYFTPQQWERLQGEHGEEAVATFLEAEIGVDIVASVVPGSYMPKSEAQVQSQVIAYAQILPALLQAGDPELIAYAAENFKMPEHLGGFSSDKAYVARLVDRFEELANMFIEAKGDLPSNSLEPVEVPVTDEYGRPVIDPATGGPAVQMQEAPAKLVAQRIHDYAQMPVDIFLDNHQAIIDALRDWRRTDAGRNASNVLLASVALRLCLHQEGIAKQAQIATRTEIAANEPAQEEMDEQAAKEQARMEAQQAQQLQLEAAKTAEEQSTKDAERAAQSEDKTADRMHQLDMKAMDLLHRERLAEQKDSATPKAGE
jgi:hypothetical protein